MRVSNEPVVFLTLWTYMRSLSRKTTIYTLQIYEGKTKSKGTFKKKAHLF